MVTTRSLGARKSQREFSRVVLPADAAPLIKILRRSKMSCCKISPIWRSAKSLRVMQSTLKRRIETHVPSTAIGGITAHNRDPSVNRASTTGEVISMRRPSGKSVRSIKDRVSVSLIVSTCSSLPLRSTQTSQPPLTITSRTVSSLKNSSSRRDETLLTLTIAARFMLRLKVVWPTHLAGDLPKVRRRQRARLLGQK